MNISGAYIRKTILLAALLFVFTASGWCEAIWSEDFVSDEGVGAIGPAPTITSPTSGKWSVDVNSCDLEDDTDWLKVVSSVMEARDLNGEGIWSSESIDIANHTGISLSVTVSESGDHEEIDYLKVYYIIDAGSEILFSSNGENTGDFGSATATQTDLNGDSVKLIVKLNNNADDEYLRFDNLIVSGTPIGGVADPSGFTASAANSSQNNLSWTKNGNGDDVLVAWNTSDTFGEPSGSYNVNDAISGGGTVIYNGSGTSYNHTSLAANTAYYYKAWSVDGSTNYSSGVTANATTAKVEPTNHVSSFTVAKDGTNGHSAIDISWLANDGAQAPDGYLIKASTADNITDPSDGTAVDDNTTIGSNSGAKNITHGTNSYEWTGLTAEQTYYFKIYPYTNSGSNIDYKTDGTVPTGNTTTDAAPELPKVLISEVTDPDDNTNGRFVELYNAESSSVDLTGWSLRRYANANTTSTDVSLSGSIASGGILVISYEDNTDFNTIYGVNTDFSNGNAISGNGDDTYELYNGSDVIDIYGEVGTDGTGEAWEYENSRAIRDGVSSGNQTWTASEWTITSADVADCTPGALDNDQSLPVELTSFKAVSRGGKVHLTWVTESETDNLGFIVYKSIEDGKAEEQASYRSDRRLQGQGSTTQRTVYEFTDEAVRPGVRYVYRLADVDINGKVTRHPAQAIIVRAPGLRVKNAWPNPFNPVTNFTVTTDAKSHLDITVFDVCGRRVKNPGPPADQRRRLSSHLGWY